MALNWRQLSIIVVLLLILAGWSTGIGWFLGIDWLTLFLSMALAVGISYVLHYREGADWLKHQLGARQARSRTIDQLYACSELKRKPNLYVTQPLSAANAFTVTYAEEDAVFVTPEIHKAPARLKAPILAHEMAHVAHNDSLIVGFVSAFEQMIGNLGRLWVLLFLSGPVGWLVLLLFWPFLLLVQFWSFLTLGLYQPIASTLLREREFRADEKAAEWTSPQAMKEALRGLENYNRQWIPTLFQRNEGPLSTHPPVRERLNRLDTLT